VSNWSVRRIHQIASITGASTYLEVGVFGGDTFIPVALRYKDAVDPAFRFDATGLSTDEVRYFQMSSDAFFASSLPRPKYDIIFLDGLHTFAQTFRDFIATLPLAHAKTVWLLDDTVPSDPWSALPDMRISYETRGRAGIPGNPWHGDVYKVVYAIHDFCPNLNYATITDGGNPQTLIWMEPRVNFAPAFDSLESIERLSYFDMGLQEAPMRYEAEQDAMARLRAALRPEAAPSSESIFAS